MIARRSLLALTCMAALAACARHQVVPENPDPIGDYSMGSNLVVSQGPEIGPFSRQATDDEWKAVIEQALTDRFSKFKGSGTYHIAVKVEAYALAQPGIPIVFKPKSILVLSANVWSTTGKLNEKPQAITVYESVSGKTLLGSGLTETKEEQMRSLAFNAAARIEDWMRKNPQWFQPGASVVLKLDKPWVG